jgi:hypothetical protein
MQCHCLGSWRKTEVAAVDPIASMQAIQNKGLAAVATKVREELKAVVQSL